MIVLVKMDTKNQRIDNVRKVDIMINTIQHHARYGGYNLGDEVYQELYDMLRDLKDYLKAETYQIK